LKGLSIKKTYAAFTHAGLTTKYRTKISYKSIIYCQGYAIYTVVYEEDRKPA